MTTRDDTALKVAIVEDESRLRDLLVREISAMGHHAEGFPSAEKAWPRILAGIDAVILDLNLPGMEGMELFGRIREERLDTAVVILTGFGALDSAVQAIRWEVEDYLTKPCSLADIDRVLAKVLAKRRGQEPRKTVERHDDSRRESHTVAREQATTATGVTLAESQRHRVLEALSRHGGNKAAVAAELGISLRTLYNRINEYRIQGFMP